MKTINVHGIKMSSLEEMMFSKYIRENGIAMNTKTSDERLAIALGWLEDYLKHPDYASQEYEDGMRQAEKDLTFLD